LIDSNKINDFELIVGIDMTIEVQLLVKKELVNFFDVTNLQDYKNIIILSQILIADYGHEKFEDNNEKKVFYHHRRRFSSLIEPDNNIFSETEKETLPPIITFYSYKGGLGRTTTLACFAAYMAMTKNKKVVIVDCDFEAPGFSNGNYFFLDTQKEVCGVVEYLLDKEFKAHLGEKNRKRGF
jgi:Flp pilus assembly CpaE family ATPase